MTDKKTQQLEDEIAHLHQRLEAFEAREAQLTEALEWYVENDDTNEGQPGNEFWLAGLDRARKVLEVVKMDKKMPLPSARSAPPRL